MLAMPAELCREPDDIPPEIKRIMKRMRQQQARDRMKKAQ
jgi:hypothetical protein